MPYHELIINNLKQTFQFKVNEKSMIWHYKRYFNCDSKNVIYIVMRNTCE